MGDPGVPSSRSGSARVLPVVLAALCALGAARSAPSPSPRERDGLSSGPRNAKADRDAMVLFHPRDAAHLATVLDAAWADAADRGEVPAIAPLALPDDMARLSPETRKRTFLRSVAPHLLDVNRGIDADRRRLATLAARLGEGLPLSGEESSFVEATCGRYGVAGAEARLSRGDLAGAVDLLLEHVDVIPVRLALAQAVVESGWGSSLLARRDNSLFGQCVPKAIRPLSARPGPDGLWYARFTTLRAGVEAYVRNLNGFEAYQGFRRARAAMRRKGEPLDAVHLAGGLLRYSELREEYVAKVRRVIRSKDVGAFARSRLAPLRMDAPAAEKAQDILALAGGAPTEGPDA